MGNEQTKMIVNGRERCYVEDTDAQNNLKDFLESYIEGNRDSVSVHVKGEGGVGKSTLLKKTAEAFYIRNAAVYIEISACTNEVEVLRLLVEQLRGIDKDDFKFDKFMFIYDWFYGSYSKKPKAGLEEEEKLRNIWEEKLKDDLIDWGKDFFEPLAEVIFAGNLSASFNAGIKIIKKIAETVKGLNDREEELDYLYSISERVESERSRRNLLKDLFIEEYPKEVSGRPLKMIFIIDNFCLQSGTGFARDLEWLIGSKGLLNTIPAAWVIGSRMIFQLGIENVIVLKGFSRKQADKYIKTACEDFTELEKQRGLSESMLELAEEQNGNNVIYLPYKLNIIVNHYWDMKDKKGKSELTIDEFKAVDGELVSEYFYMDLPEYRVNAAQILSCMDTWNEERLDVVRKKFNDLLLNARHLLQSNISIEEIGNGNFKLHESTKDALYKNKRNVIKYDVQEFIFKELCDLLLDNDLTELDVRDFEICNMYIVLSMEYLKYILKENENKPLHKQMLKKLYDFRELTDNDRNEVEKKFYMFFKCLKYIYDGNCKQELIYEEFVDFYEKIINDLREVINSSENLSYSPLYIKHRKKLADLYTNISRPDKAEQIEKECLEQAEYLYNIEKEKTEITNQLFLAEDLLLNCRNAYAYDMSFEWQYGNAYEEGKKGLDESTKFICKTSEDSEECNRSIIGNILTILDSHDNGTDKKKLKDTLELLNKIYIFDVDIAIDSDEFPNREAGSIPYNDLVEAYHQLLLEGKNTRDAELKKRVNTLIDILFKNVNKLRGNFPWYCICEKKREANEIIKFAIKTYLLRKAQHEALQKEDVVKNYSSYAKGSYAFSLISYHNLGVYYFRLKKFDEAFEIGMEACFRRMHKLQSFDLLKLNDAQNIRYEHVKDRVKEHYISDIIEKLNIAIMEHLQTNNATLESIQYLGNYLLYKKNYKMAIDKLGEAYINRYIRYGIKQSKTLDCGLRLALAFYGSEDRKLAMDLLKDICKSANDFLGMGITPERLQEYKEVKKKIEAKEPIKDILQDLL